MVQDEHHRIIEEGEAAGAEDAAVPQDLEGWEDNEGGLWSLYAPHFRSTICPHLDRPLAHAQAPVHRGFADHVEVIHGQLFVAADVSV